MKQTKVICIIALMACIAAGFATPLFADDDATINMLCSAPWRASGFKWSRIRIFKKDGTFTTQGIDFEAGTWSISGNTIILTFANNKHTDIISLPLNPDGTTGNDELGGAMIAVQLPPAPLPPTPEIQQKAQDIINSDHNDLALVSGKEGDASGFIAVMGKSNFLFTNTGIVAGLNNAAFKTIDGAPIPPGAASVAVARDVFCMAAPPGGTPLGIMDDVEKNAAAGDDVVVLVNAEGEGIAKSHTGQILKITPDHVEISMDAFPGYIGSPIIHMKTGKVIGLGAFGVTEDHHYCSRLDNIKGWQVVNWQVFYAQADEMEKIDRVTSQLSNFLLSNMANSSGKIRGVEHASPAIEDCFYHWQTDTAGKQNDDELNRANRTLVSALKAVSQTDVTAARQHISYDYFLRELADEQKARDAMADGFKKLIDKFSD